MDEFEQTIEQLESLFVDPQFKASLDKVRSINASLLVAPASESEAEHLVRSLNEKWLEDGYHYRKLHVTGGGYVGGRYEDVTHFDEDRSGLAPLTERSVRSRGFTFRSTPVIDENGALSVSQEIMLRGLIKFDTDTGIKGVKFAECAVPLRPGTMVECRDMTPQKAGAWLQVYHQGTKELIDESLRQADDEAEATMNVKMAPLPLANGDKKEVKHLRKVLQAYLQAHITYEEYIPYTAVLSGRRQAYNPTINTYEAVDASPDEVIMNIISSEVRANTVTDAFEIWLSVRIIESKKEAFILQFPLESLMELRSGRKRLE